METADHEQGAAGAGPARRRRWLVALGVLAVVLVAPLALAGGLWLRLAAGPLVLPDALTARIEARLDRAMAANGVTLGSVEVARPGGSDRIALRLTDVRLTDPDGMLRAGFPEVTATLATGPLLRGQVHPIGVELSNAGLRLSRDAEGGVDLALIAGEGADALDVPETLARIDRMFAAPVFADLAGVTATGLTLAMADAMTGQILRVSDARMRLDRTAEGLTVTLGGALEGSRDATIDIALTRLGASGRTNMGFAFRNLAARDVATAGPALGWVDLMRAPISGFVGGTLGDDGVLGDLRATLDIGAGQLNLGGAAAPLSFERLASAIRYEAATGRLHFDSLSLTAPDLSLDAEGHADAAPDGSRYTAQFRLRDIRAVLPDLYPDPLTLDGAMVDMRVTLWPELQVELGQAVIEDDGLRLSASGSLTSGAEGVRAALDVHLPEADAPSLLAYWPPGLAAHTRGWIAERLLAGRVRDVDFALRTRPGAAPEHALDLDFDAVSLAVLPAMPPVEGAAGYLSLTGPQLMLRLDEGQMPAPGGAAVAVDGSSMRIADTRPQGPLAVIDLALAGELRDVLTLLTLPPVRLFEGGALTPERIGSGGVTAQAHIETRLTQQEGLAGTRFAAEAQLGGFASDTLVPGRRLTGDLLQVSADNDAVRIAGRADFDGVPLSGVWTRPLGPGSAAGSRLEAQATLSRARLAALGLDLPDWMISGETQAAVDLDLPDAAPAVLSLRSDLAGLRLALPPLGWVLGAGQTGSLAAEVRLGAAPSVTRLALQGAGLDLAGRVVLTPGGGFERLVADRFALGGWMDVRGEVVGRGRGRAPAVTLSGGNVDLRGAPQGGTGGGAGGGGPVTANLDRLQISEGIALTGLRADLTSDGGLSGQFIGQVNDAAFVTGTLVATPEGPAVRVRAEDGGAVLRAAGVFRTAYGGAMELILQATGATGTYDGTLSIENPRLRDAPVMAELLNLISVVGLLEQLGGEGINLGNVDARFRLTPAQVILSEGTAVGPALGLSLDGTYDLSTSNLDMQGVVSPLYVVNGLIGAIFAPRREGLFGFSYRLTGRADNPQVFVNPLSILTPGVFREIFRRPPPELSGN